MSNSERLKQRLEILESASGSDPKAKEMRALLLEKCRRDIVFWINNFCYAYSPRTLDKKNYGGSEVPISLFPYQKWVIPQWLDCVKKGEDFGVVKSRDMGATWMIVWIFQHQWIFEPGSTFHCGTMTMDKLETGRVDPGDTLFGKFRYNLEHLPTWMIPRYQDKYKMIQNLENGNTFTGEASAEGFGRSARNTAMLFDELQQWGSAKDAWDSAAQTTPCRIFLGTPNGMGNTYAKLSLDKINEWFRFPGDAEIKQQKKIAWDSKRFQAGGTR